MKVLITGSRSINDPALVKRIIKRLKERGDEIIVGDARGVDTTVIRICNANDIPYTCYTPHDESRNKSAVNVKTNQGSNYIERDRIMAEACDMCIAVWDGESAGTQHTFRFARKLGKRTHIWKRGNGWIL